MDWPKMLLIMIFGVFFGMYLRDVTNYYDSKHWRDDEDETT